MSVLTGYESAGVSYVNGERVNGNNANPYANANAPPVPAHVPAYPSSDNGEHRSSFGSNLGYPPYPSNTGSSAHGYPPYPSSTNQAGRQQDLGYPPYPTQNRMPIPGAYPSYPQNTGYPQAPANYPQHPGYQNPYQTSPNQRGYNSNSNSIYRRNASIGTVASMILVGFSELFLLVTTRWY